MERESISKIIELSECEMQISGEIVHHLQFATYLCAAGAAIWHSIEGSYMAGYEAASNR